MLVVLQAPALVGVRVGIFEERLLAESDPNAVTVLKLVDDRHGAVHGNDPDLNCNKKILFLVSFPFIRH